MQSSGEQPLVGEEHCVTTLITAAKETNLSSDRVKMVLCVCVCHGHQLFWNWLPL